MTLKKSFWILQFIVTNLSASIFGAVHLIEDEGYEKGIVKSNFLFIFLLNFPTTFILPLYIQSEIFIDSISRVGGISFNEEMSE